ncbi:hypothetical protein HMI56_004843 [Coelomomyces lativittatus]|nr:hypothetical protein HMI56_004843 [Coelomomyces lativittatus]
MTSQLDRKRIYGPESSVPPLPLLTELSTRSTTSLDFKDDEDERMEPTSSFSTDFKTPSSLEHLEVGQRLDPSRSIDSIRGLFMQTGVLPQADGSSLIELGQLKLLCAVYGPKPDRKTGTTEKGKLSVSFRFATFANPVRKSFLQDATEKDYSTFLYNALLPSVRLTSFPKSKVDVYVTLLQNDGVHASLASAVTAASLALVDAGIEVMDLVAGSSAVITLYYYFFIIHV